MLKKTIYITLFIFLNSCSNHNAQSLIDDVIAEYGGDKWNTADIRFSFRGNKYQIRNNNGKYKYSEVKIVNEMIEKLELTNERLSFYRNDTLFNVPDSVHNKHYERLNSIVYFTSIPFNLNDKAVQKKYLGYGNIKDHSYDKIEITFKKESGGIDYDDVFLYWVNQKTKRIDYFAYKYNRNNGGSRFRVTTNARRVNGILFVDHENYKAEIKIENLQDYEDLLTKGKLVKVSEVKIKNIKVK